MNVYYSCNITAYVLFICFQFYYAEYPFQSRATNEVSLFEGQVVTVYVKHDKEGNSEWWYVDADGVKGYVPSNYLSPMSWYKKGWRVCW